MDQSAMAAVVVFFILLGTAGLAVWIWALVDAVRVPDESMFRAGNKLIWVLVIVLAGFVGAIVYLIVGRPAASTRSAPPGAPVPPPPPGSLG